MQKINFRLRGTILIILGIIVLVTGIFLYYQLNVGKSLFSTIMGITIPLFVIGYLLIRASIRVKKGQSPFGY